ncbi:MFS transporter [Picrophilus oshimae]|uniref:Predicted arabinose efflux permease, MFS family n=1 Tax=Picrophilus torridus (strain ATCC 700027 / DSM 9790 / JCM 10055 / NBRC 100828 / KAW 2/3) TaxID=1122961 RepID=A0A8G2FXL6_PICTO|nr:MFS transporter [Picrophilus oshimae]SMD31355.1 Predicted arabinose efflux permease, MFS family [Picrophilus oshimae DSM 9789]
MFTDSYDEVDRSFKFLLISRAARSVSLIFVTLSLSLYLHALHYPVTFIGLLYVPITIFNVFLTFFLGTAGDRIGYSRVLFIGELFPLVGMLILAVSTNIYLIALGAIIAGITGGAGGMRGAFSPGMTAYVASSYDVDNLRVQRLSLLNATASFFSIFSGLMLGSYIIFKSYVNIIEFYHIFFYVSFALVLVSVISLAMLKEFRRPKKTTRMMKKESFKYLLKIIAPNTINAAAIGIMMPLLPLWFELSFHIGPSYVGDIYTVAYASTAIGSFVSGRYINGRVNSLFIASVAHVIQGAFFVILAFTPYLIIASALYIIRMGIAGIGSPMRGAINVRGINREDYGTGTSIQGVSNRSAQLTTGLSGYLMDYSLGLPLIIGGIIQAIGGIVYYDLLKSYYKGRIFTKRDVDAK